MEKPKKLSKLFSLLAIILPLSACSCTNPDSPLYGEWQMIDWNGEGKPMLDISLKFQANGEFQDSRSDDAIWNYEYIKPDSLILFHHSFYEERYKILSLSNDTLIISLKESKFHAEEKDKEVTTNYGDSSVAQFTFTRKK